MLVIGRMMSRPVRGLRQPNSECHAGTYVMDRDTTPARHSFPRFLPKSSTRFSPHQEEIVTGHPVLGLSMVVWVSSNVRLSLTDLQRRRTMARPSSCICRTPRKNETSPRRGHDPAIKGRLVDPGWLTTTPWSANRRRPFESLAIACRQRRMRSKPLSPSKGRHHLHPVTDFIIALVPDGRQLADEPSGACPAAEDRPTSLGYTETAIVHMAVRFKAWCCCRTNIGSGSGRPKKSGWRLTELLPPLLPMVLSERLRDLPSQSSEREGDRGNQW